MEHTTFAKKTVVLAALGALSLMAATARADGTETPSDPQPKKIEVTVGSDDVFGIASEIKDADTSVAWDDEWLEGVLGENGQGKYKCQHHYGDGKGFAYD